MLVGLAGLLSGYNGGFEFKSGVEYPADLPHTAMRVILASFGVMLVPLAWWTAGEMGWSRFTRHWVTICVLCGMPLASIYTSTRASVALPYFESTHNLLPHSWVVIVAYVQISVGSVSPASSCSTRCSSSSPSRQLLVSSNSTASDMTRSTKIGGYGWSLPAGPSAVYARSSGWGCS